MSDRHPEFEASIAEAKVYPEIWRLLLGVLLIVLIYLSTTVLILGIAVGVVASTQGPWVILGYLQELNLGQKPGHLLVMLATFFGMALGPILAAAALHFRGPATLFGEFGDWIRGFTVALIVTAAFVTAISGLYLVTDAPLPNLPWGEWLRWMPLAIPLLMLQIGAEELLFRGYLQQQLAARFRSRVVWMWVPSVLFALLHFSPDAGANVILILLSTLTFGLVAADLTERTGSLGAAMGLHFANNFFALFIVTLGPKMTGLALYVSPYDLGQTGIISLGLTLNVFVILAIWWVCKLILDR